MTVWRSPRGTLARPFSLVLAAMTGAVLAHTVATVTMPLAAPVPSSDTAATVRRFYAVVNEVIRTGDVDVLDEVAAPSFVDHVSIPGVTSDRAGLGQYLMRLHHASSWLRLVVEELVTADDRALTHVTVRGTPANDMLGIPLAEPLVLWGHTDVFRVTGRHVVERWSDVTGFTSVEDQGGIALGADLPANGIVGLERVTLAPGDQVVGSSGGARVVALESGSLSVSIDRSSPHPALMTLPADAAPSPRLVHPGASAMLVRGSLMSIPDLMRFTLINSGTEAATALVTTILMPEGSDVSGAPIDLDVVEGDGAWSPGTVVRPLTGVVATNLSAGSVEVRMGQVVLMPGTRLHSVDVLGPVLLWIASGTLEIVTSGGMTWARRGANGAGESLQAGSLARGDGVLIPGGSTVSLHAIGTREVAVHLVVFLPAKEATNGS